MKFAGLAAVMAVLVFASTASAMQIPSLAQHRTRPGARISGSLGFGAAYVAWPTRIEVSLVSSSAARDVARRTDPRLIRVVTLHPAGGFMANRFSFIVPRLRAGEFVLAVWLRSNKTGPWRNAAAFLYPLNNYRRRVALTIQGH